jgi:hypothetical protein
MKHLAKYLTVKDTFGPIWTGESNQLYVMDCLRKYLRQEGHSALLGKTVQEVAQIFIADHYAASGEELDALACLLIHDKSKEVI